MFLVAGLGNPGEKYMSTRHNVGFLSAEYIAEQLHANFFSTKWQAAAAKAVCENEQLILLKPQTFMNLSGNAIAPAASYYKIPPPNIIVIHDDLDLPVGRIKIAVNRGAGGHNGIRSIISHLGKDFVRIKIGIGRPDSPIPVERYVLTKMTSQETEILKTIMPDVYEAVRLCVGQGVDMAMNKVNSSENSM